MTNQSPSPITAIGNALLDIELKVSRADLLAQNLTIGNMALVDTTAQNALYTQLFNDNILSKSGGGSAANTIATLALFAKFQNHPAPCFIAQVGNDEFGTAYINDLTHHGVNTNDMRVVAGDTGTCLVLIDEHAERTMNSCLGVSADLRVPNLPDGFIYLEGYLAFNDKAVQDLKALNRKQTIVSFSDPSVVKFARNNLLTMLGDGVYAIFCNMAEALTFLGLEEATLATLGEALGKYARMVVITNGEHGAYAHTPRACAYAPSCHVDAINTNGAGDGFAAGFLWAHFLGHDLKVALDFAHRVSACVVQKDGARIGEDDAKTLLDQF